MVEQMWMSRTTKIEIEYKITRDYKKQKKLTLRYVSNTEEQKTFNGILIEYYFIYSILT